MNPKCWPRKPTSINEASQRDATERDEKLLPAPKQATKVRPVRKYIPYFWQKAFRRRTCSIRAYLGIQLHKYDFLGFPWNKFPRKWKPLNNRIKLSEWDKTKPTVSGENEKKLGQNNNKEIWIFIIAIQINIKINEEQKLTVRINA